MSDNTEKSGAETNVQVQSSPKTPAKRKLTSTERALAESAELVRQWGGSTEGGRRTRSSTRGRPATPPAPPPKKARISTPRGGRKLLTNASNDTEATEDAPIVKEVKLKPVAKEDVTDSADQQTDAVVKNGASLADVAAPKPEAPEKMEVDSEAVAESTNSVENNPPVVEPVPDVVDKPVEKPSNQSIANDETARLVIDEQAEDDDSPMEDEPEAATAVVSEALIENDSSTPSPIVETPPEPVEAAEESVKNHIEEVVAVSEPPVAVDELIKVPAVAVVEPIVAEPVVVEPIDDVDTTDGIAPTEVIIPSAQEAPTIPCPVVVGAAEIAAPVVDVPIAAEVPAAIVAAEPPQELPVDDAVQIAEATPAIVQPEPVSADQQEPEVVTKNGDAAANIEHTPVEQPPANIADNLATKLDNATGNEASVKLLETIPATNAAV